MTLTDAQRQQLGTQAEWRDMQISLHNVYTYLSITKLEDIQMQDVVDALEQLSQRRAAYLERYISNQGGL